MRYSISITYRIIARNTSVILAVFFCSIVGLNRGFADATVLRASVPLVDACISCEVLSRCLTDELHLPNEAVGSLLGHISLDLKNANGWVAVGLNAGLGDGFHVSVERNVLSIELDPDKLPRDWDGICDSLIRFTSVTAPVAVARQNARFGLFVPPLLDANKPLVILIHGMDGDISCCGALADLLSNDGFQTGCFVYPAERPLAQSAGALARSMDQLRDAYPNIRIDFVTESMGGLIARSYVEGADFRGNVDHLILVAPPNAGSTWAKFAVVNKIANDLAEYHCDAEWSPAWIVNEGLCQAGRDLRPGSKFLRELNQRPRRMGVNYTIIAGDRSIIHRVEANVLLISSQLLGNRLSGLWGFRQTRTAMNEKATHLLDAAANNDGPVSLNSARLAGVDDFVVLPADHLSLYESVGGRPPAAWPAIENRLLH